VFTQWLSSLITTTTDQERVHYLIRNLRRQYLENINVLDPHTVKEVLEAMQKIAETEHLLNHRDKNSIEVHTLATRLKKLLESISEKLSNSLEAISKQYEKALAEQSQQIQTLF